METYTHRLEGSHWQTRIPISLENKYGFIYLIHNKVLDKYYLGRKILVRGGSKRSRTYGKSAAWRFYTGSSRELNKDIKELGKDNFSFYLISLWETKGGLHYAEANLQHKLDVLTAIDKKGNRIFYNKNIGAIRYIPHEFSRLKRRRFYDPSLELIVFNKDN